MVNNDIRIAVLVYGKYKHLPRAEAVKAVAKDTRLSVTGVSGMATRGYNSIKGRLAVMQYIADNLPTETPSEKAINSIVRQGKQKWASHRQSLNPDKAYYAISLTDIHFPVPDWQALQLAYELVSRTPNVAYISTLHDALDFPSISTHPDRRRKKTQAYDDDIMNTVDLHKQHMNVLQSIAPDALGIAVNGNHDNRIASFGREAGTDNMLTAAVMQALHNQGVTFTSPLGVWNIINIHPDLKWTHGWYSSVNRASACKKNYEQAKRELSERRDFNLVFGHTHGQYTYRHGEVQVFNAGCLCNMDVPYMNRRGNWQHGIHIAKFTLADETVEGYNIPFIKRGNHLIARHPFTGEEVKV